MSHVNTVLTQLLHFVPRHSFQKLINQHQGDKHTWSLTFWSQFVTLLVGQLSGADSLRRLIEQLDVHSQRHYHLGLQSVRKSTLADANHKRPTAAYYGLVFQLLSRLSKKKGLADIVGQVQLIDSTTISLCQSQYQYQWASFCNPPIYNRVMF